MVCEKPDSEVVFLFWKDSFHRGSQMGKVFKYSGILLWFLNVFVFCFVLCFGDIVLSQTLAKVFGDGPD